MKCIFPIVTVLSLMIAACHTAKKNTAAAEPISREIPGPPIPETPGKTADGVYQPGPAELAAIQERYKNVNMSHIQEGYYLYAKGACIQCHGTANIYKYDEIRWAAIIDKMALEAKISAEQKKSVFFYVMSVRAAKDKESK